MKKLIMTIKVVDEDEKEVNEELRKAVLESRSEMCDIVNGSNGAIEKYNELTEMLDIDAEDGVYIDVYEMLSNTCWTKLLQKKGFHYIILSDYIKETNNIFNLMRGINYEVTIKLKKA